MKKILPWMSLLIIIALAACTLPGRTAQEPPAAALSTPTLSAQQMQTQIAQMLTQMPTGAAPAQPAGEVTATQVLPTVPPESPEAGGEVGYPVVTATTAPEATAIQAAPAPDVATATQIPPTQAPADQPTATQIPPTQAPAAAATATSPAGPTFTPPPDDPRNRFGPPTSTDSMDIEDTWTWPVGSDRYTYGVFSNGVQTIAALSGTDGWRMANPVGREFGDVYVEATFRLGKCAGTDHYGLIVRVPELHEPDQGYLFGLTCDGRYSLRRWDGEVRPKGEMKWLVNWTANPAIATGSNQVNRIGILTTGSRLALYVNGKLLTEVQDSTYRYGYFGVFIGEDQTANFTIQVDEMSYWENPR